MFSCNFEFRSYFKGFSNAFRHNFLKQYNSLLKLLFLVGCTPVGTPLEGSPPSSFDESSPTNKGYYKKKDENEVLFQGTKNKLNKKSRADRKQQSTKKLLAHNPETFAQFAELNLFPPTQTGDVPASMDALKERLAFYEDKSDEEQRICQNKPVNGVEPVVQIVVDPVQVIVEEPETNCEADENEESDITNEVVSVEHIDDYGDAQKKSQGEDKLTNGRAHLTLNLQKSGPVEECDQIVNKLQNGSSYALTMNSNRVDENAASSSGNDGVDNDATIALVDVTITKKTGGKCGGEDASLTVQPQDIHQSIV